MQPVAGPGGRRRSAVFAETSTALVPLRPLTVGEALDAAFLVIRSSPRQLLGLPLVVAACFAAVAAAASALWLVLADLDAVVAQVLLALGTLLVGGVAVIAVVMWLQGVLTRQCLFTVLGERLSAPPPSSFRARLRLLLPMLGAYLLMAAWLMLAGGLAIAGETWFALSAQRVDDPTLRSVVLLLAWVAAVYVGCWIWSWVSQLVPLYVAEGPDAAPWIGLPRRRQSMTGAFGRSLRLVGLRDSFRLALGFAATIVCVSAVAFMLTMGLLLLLYAYAEALRLTMGPDELALVIAIGGVIAYVSTAIVAVAYLAALQTIFYLDLRMRREGLDLALRFPRVPVPEPGVV